MGEFVSWGRDPLGNVQSHPASPMPADCFYLGGMVPVAPDGCGCRIGGLGESYCIMMRRLPCPENCPDRKSKG